MTAEVAILNREAVAIAADSASTGNGQSRQKIFSSANKIFSLSKYHPVGVMIYGNANFMGVPWETIIKIFRKKLRDKKFDQLMQYGEEFIKFLKNESNLFPESEQEKYAKGCIYGYFLEIRNEVLKTIEKTIEKEGNIEVNRIETIADEIISNNLKRWEAGECNVDNKREVEKELSEKYNKIYESALKDIFEKIPLSQKAKNSLSKIATNLFLCFPEGISNSGISGVVITGFGEDEIFPSIISYSIEGIANNILKYKQTNFEQVDYDKSAIINPFAQMEMVQTFINGISPLFYKLYNNLISETIDNYPRLIISKLVEDVEQDVEEDLIKQLKKITNSNLREGIKKIDEIQYRHFIEPILKVVTFLPKNELAEMAESLVNLTCLRKKISMDEETVGGPIDVAVISKGDGLIWIRRKHYFERELNQHFFMNYLNK
ncbi:MAG: hypothetical protein K9I94_03175 [Bacteroidales bacterium]|nr:hypothetical protein [Bacteroidales bacterium]